jgi:hypothetical protein
MTHLQNRAPCSKWFRAEARLPIAYRLLAGHSRAASPSGALFALCLVPRDQQRILSQASARSRRFKMMTFPPAIGHGPAKMQERAGPACWARWTDVMWPEHLRWSNLMRDDQLSLCPSLHGKGQQWPNSSISAALFWASQEILQPTSHTFIMLDDVQTRTGAVLVQPMSRHDPILHVLEATRK